MRSILLGGLLAGVLLSAPSPAAAPTLVGKDAPDFVLKGMDGRNLRMSEFRGQVVLVNFWVRWAGDSRQEMPALDRINNTYSRAGLVVRPTPARHLTDASTTAEPGPVARVRNSWQLWAPGDP